MDRNLFVQTSCIILSAGSSERMGEPKALLKFSKEETFIQKITGTYVQCGVQQVIVVVNKELFHSIHEQKILLGPEVQLVINSFPERGRFFSLQKGVHKLKPGNSCFFQNIDNPFTSKSLLFEIFGQKEEADVLVPAFRNMAGHPVFLNPLVIEKLSLNPDTDIRIDSFLNKFEIKKIETIDETILVNINSLEDYIKASFGV